MLIKIICKDYFRERGNSPTNGSDFSWDKMKDECNTPPVLALAALVTSRIASLKSITGRLDPPSTYLRKRTRTVLPSNVLFPASGFYDRFLYLVVRSRWPKAPNVPYPDSSCLLSAVCRLHGVTEYSAWLRIPVYRGLPQWVLWCRRTTGTSLECLHR